MNKPDIALIGRSRTGKDTIADYLVREHGYVRVAFADALKGVALAANPVISHIPNFYTDGSSEPVYLREVVLDDGWERAKDEYPEARRFLQNLGVSVRDTIGPDTWLAIGMRKVREAHARGNPVVVTDVRFSNEAAALEYARFMTVSVTRPCRITEGLDAVDTHVSETELANFPTDRAICNAGTVADLYADVEKVCLGK